MTPTSKPRRQWSEDELVVLAAIYNSASFSVGDDARDECQTIADCFGRTASSIDRQWRNMDAVVKGKTGLNIGKLVVDASLQFISNPAAHRKIALGVCRRNDWPLDDLIIEGRQQAQNRPKVAELDRVVRNHLLACCQKVEFKVFAPGSQGFEGTDTVDINQGRYRVTVTAVVVGSKVNRGVRVTTSSRSIAKALEKIVEDVEPKKFATGRVGYYGIGRIMLDDHVFQVSIKAVQIGDNQ